jgi:hypothetical protein
MNKRNGHKPIIETLINTAALAMTSTGVIFMTNATSSNNLFIRGVFMIVLGAFLEFFKYKGRDKKLW